MVVAAGGEGLGKGWGCRNPFRNVPSESACVGRHRWLLSAQPDKFYFVLICSKVGEEKRRRWSLASHHLGGRERRVLRPFRRKATLRYQSNISIFKRCHGDCYLAQP